VKMKGLVRSNLFITLPKNALQFLVGAACFYSVYGTIDVLRSLLGLTALCIAYASIYPFNDIMDREEDVKNGKQRLKPIARGDMTVEEAVSLSFILLAAGLALSALVSTTFMMLILVLLVLNFLHSSTFTRLRNRPIRHPNMVLMQFVKFSTGWFALTCSAAGFPLLLILCVSLIYAYGYMLYKVDIRNAKAVEANGIGLWLVIILSILTYLASFLLYDFKVPMLITTVMVIPAQLLITKPKDNNSRVNRGLAIPPLLFMVFIVACFLGL